MRRAVTFLDGLLAVARRRYTRRERRALLRAAVWRVTVREMRGAIDGVDGAGFYALVMEAQG